MKKRNFSLGVAATAALAVICMVAPTTHAQQTKQVSSKDFHVALKNNTKFTVDQNPTKPVIATAKLGYDVKHPENTKIDINLHTETNGSALQVGGTGVLHIGNENFTFSILTTGDGIGSELHKFTYNGKSYYDGVLQGLVKNKKGEDDIVSINAIFSEDQTNQVFNVIVGTVSEDVFLSFGDNGFVTKDLVEKTKQF